MSISEKLLNLDLGCLIAIDGLAASGKGTLARILSKRFGLVYCQTSIFYRQLAYNVLKDGVKDSIEGIIELSKQNLEVVHDSECLYTPDVTEITSIVAAIPEVRNNLLKPQRDFIISYKRLVIEGRDIGTVVAPEAELKLFVTADLNIRAERRRNQMIKNGLNFSIEEVVTAIAERDERDSNRLSAPLVKAKDAIEIDTTNLMPEEIVEFLLHRR